MSEFRNKEGSTGYLKDGKFEPFASQEEADGKSTAEVPEQEDEQEGEDKPAKRGRKPVTTN